MCPSCGNGRFVVIGEDSEFTYLACSNCGFTNYLPKGVKIYR